MNRKYGWLRDLPSQVPWFDHEKLLARLKRLPNHTDWWKLVTWCYDQLQIGSCTANAGVSAERLFRAIHKLEDFKGSRKFLYRVTRGLEGNSRSDSGASIASTVNAEMIYGVCEEKLCPYDETIDFKPNKSAYTDALKHQVLSKEPVQQNWEAIKACIAAGQPLQFGFSVYPSFESNAVQKTGKVLMPSRSDLREGPMGGHAQCGCDYVDAVAVGKELWTLNSWGKKSGLKGIGLFKFPKDFICDPDLAGDFWTVTKLEV